MVPIESEKLFAFRSTLRVHTVEMHTVGLWAERNFFFFPVWLRQLDLARVGILWGL